jgi:GH15 family glucan-1,4-alpha-glucosidase
MESQFQSLSNVGYIPKWDGDLRVDASALALLSPLEVVSAQDAAFKGTFLKAEEQLLEGFGVHRYRGDAYYGGGLWPLLSAFYGLAALRLGRADVAHGVLDWIAETHGEDGRLPEQINSHLLAPEQEIVWIKKWGSSASPLLWSHGMYLALFHELRSV